MAEACGGGLRANGDGFRLAIRLPTADSLCSLKVARASKISADGNFRRPLVGSGPPSHPQKWLRRKATPRRSGASSSPRSIRSQRESAVGRRTTRSGPSPLARRPPRTPPPPRSAASFPVGRAIAACPLGWNRSQDSRVLVLAEPLEARDSSPSRDKWGLLRWLARGDRAVSVGAPSEG